MRKIIIGFLLLVTVTLLVAQEKNIRDNISYIAPLKHDINLFITELNNNENFYFSDEIIIAKEDIPYLYKYSFSLGKNFRLDEVLVEGVTATVIGVNQYSNDYFKNKLTQEQLEIVGDNANLFEVELPPVDERTGTMKIVVKYILVKDKEASSFVREGNKYDFIGEYFWYPKNVLIPCTDVKVIVNSMKNFSIQADDVQIKDFDGKIQTALFSFDGNELPYDLTLIKR